MISTIQYYFSKFSLIEFFGSPIYSGVRVTRSNGEAFKSGHMVNTVAGLTYNRQSDSLAYTFVEDDSLVDCVHCTIHSDI